MSVEDTVKKEVFVFPDDGDRPIIVDYGKKNYKFMPGDEVIICPSGTQSREGPYLIEKTDSGKYTLCDHQGKKVKNGQTFDEKDLDIYDPFAA